jgi:hypothetical protein
MRISREQLYQEAVATGFCPEVLEKVFHLLTLLEGFQRHPCRFDPGGLVNHLLPLLRRTALVPGETPIAWAVRPVEECCHALEVVLPLRPTELEFLDRLFEHGEICPSLLTGDTALMDSATTPVCQCCGRLAGHA